MNARARPKTAVTTSSRAFIGDSFLSLQRFATRWNHIRCGAPAPIASWYPFAETLVSVAMYWRPREGFPGDAELGGNQLVRLPLGDGRTISNSRSVSASSVTCLGSRWRSGGTRRFQARTARIVSGIRKRQYARDGQEARARACNRSQA